MIKGEVSNIKILKELWDSSKRVNAADMAISKIIGSAFSLVVYSEILRDAAGLEKKLTVEWCSTR